MKEIIFLRHGHALPATRETGDQGRPLSPAGRQEAARTARLIRDAGFRPGLVLASPYLRAAATADLALELFPSAGRRVAPELCDGDAQGVLKLISESEADLLIVGHQPLLGLLAGYLAGCEPLHLEPAGFARLSLPEGPQPAPGAARLVEVYSPPGGGL